MKNVHMKTLNQYYPNVYILMFHSFGLEAKDQRAIYIILHLKM